MVPSVWGQVCDRLFLQSHRARIRTNTPIRRSTSARIHTLLSNREVAAPSCNAFTTGISFRHDVSLSFLFFFLLFYLIPDPIHDQSTPPWTPEQNTAVAPADKDVGLKESSAGPARNLPRLWESYESRCVLLPHFRSRSPLSLDTAGSALDNVLVAPFLFFSGLQHSPLSMC